MHHYINKISLLIVFAGLINYTFAISLEETFTKKIPAENISSVHVHNQNGFIDVESWTENQIEITAYKKVRAGSREKAEKLMEYLEIEINQSGDNLKIVTIHPQKNKDNDGGFISWLFSLGDHGGASVDYVIKVPQKMDLDLNSTNGGLSVKNCEGLIDLKTTNGKIVAENIKGSTNCKTTNGSIKVYLDKMYPKEDMAFKSTNGSIKVYLPSDINADVEAETTNGSISCDLPIKSEHRKSRRQFYGEINDGGALIYLKTTNGSIRINEI
ncbi:MAG: DUF4097 family beta strand repeat protein [Calditrichaceae bacterium]|nr:DUF4097 family beta strand repeat protein [Calditrichaceae bacterium]